MLASWVYQHILLMYMYTKEFYILPTYAIEMSYIYFIITEDSVKMLVSDSSSLSKSAMPNNSKNLPVEFTFQIN